MTLWTRGLVICMAPVHGAARAGNLQFCMALLFLRFPRVGCIGALFLLHGAPFSQVPSRWLHWRTFFLLHGAMPVCRLSCLLNSLFKRTTAQQSTLHPNEPSTQMTSVINLDPLSLENSIGNALFLLLSSAPLQLSFYYVISS